MESSNLLNSFQRISRSMVEIVDKGQGVDVRTLLEIKDAVAFCTSIFKNDKELVYTTAGPSMVKNFIEVMDLSIIQGIIPLVKDNDTLILLFQIIRYYVALLDITNATLNNEVMELLKAQNSNILHNQGELVFGNILDISTDDSFGIEIRLDATKLLWESLKYNHYFYEILITSGQIHKLIGCLDTVVAQSNDKTDYILKCFCGCIYSICKGVSVLPGVFKETVTLIENLVQVFKNNEEPLTRLFAGFSLSYIICENPEYKDNEKVKELIGYIMQNDIYAIYKETISNPDIDDGQGNVVHSFLINDDLYDDGLVMGQENKPPKPLNKIDNSSRYMPSFTSCRLTLLSVICKNNPTNIKTLIDNDYFELARALIVHTADDGLDSHDHRENELRVGNKKIRIDLFQTPTSKKQDAKSTEHRLVGFNLLSIVLPLQRIIVHQDDFQLNSKQNRFVETELFPATMQIVFKEYRSTNQDEQENRFVDNHSSDVDKHLTLSSMLSFLGFLTVSKNNLFAFIDMAEQDSTTVIRKFMDFSYRLGNFEFGANSLFYFLLYLTNIFRFYNDSEEVNEKLECFKVILVKSGAIKFALEIMLYFITPDIYQKPWTVWCRTQAVDFLASLTYNSKYAVLKLLSENDIESIWYIMKRKCDDMKILLGCVSIIKNIYCNKNISKGTMDKDYRPPKLMELVSADDRMFLDCMITNTSASYVNM